MAERLAALQGILEADEAATPHEPITAPNSQHAPDQAPVTKLKPSLPSPTRMGRREAQLERALREERAARAELRRQQAATESRLREALCALRDARLRLSAREREPQEQARESWTSCASPNAGACSLLAGGALGNKAGCACEEGTSTSATTTEALRADRARLQRALDDVTRRGESERAALKAALEESSKVLGLQQRGGVRILKEHAAAARQQSALRTKLQAASQREAALQGKLSALSSRLDAARAALVQTESDAVAQSRDLSRSLEESQQQLGAAARAQSDAESLRIRAEADRSELLDGYAEQRDALRACERKLSDALSALARRPAKWLSRRAAAVWRIQARVHAARSRSSTGGAGHEEAIRALLRLDSPYVPTGPATPEPFSRRRGDAGESPGGWESLAAQGGPSKSCAEGEGVKLLLAQERDRALAAEAQAQKAESTRARHEEAARRAAVRARDAEASVGMLRGLAREVEEARVAQACLRKEVLDQERLFGSERERLVRLLDSALASKVAAEAQAQAAHSAAEAQGEAIRELEAAAGLQRRREGAMQRAEEEVERRSQHAAVEAAAAGREATAALDALTEARRLHRQAERDAETLVEQRCAAEAAAAEAAAQRDASEASLSEVWLRLERAQLAAERANDERERALLERQTALAALEEREAAHRKECSEMQHRLRQMQGAAPLPETETQRSSPVGCSATYGIFPGPADWGGGSEPQPQGDNNAAYPTAASTPTSRPCSPVAGDIDALATFARGERVRLESITLRHAERFRQLLGRSGAAAGQRPAC